MTATTPTPSDTDAPQGLARRSFLGCALAFGVAGPILAACSSGDDTEGGSGGGSGGSSGGDQPKAGTKLVATADVPVGGGVALTDVKIVVTQPTEGEFKAFSAICTHQGSTIDKVEDGDMVCPLHGSRFSIKDGSVDNGPATNPVKEISIKVEGDQVVLA
jgi:nitrite reductase/ring-hydroxylating ferredoxin subunit